MDQTQRENIEGAEQPKELRLPSLEGRTPAELLAIYQDVRVFDGTLSHARELSAARAFEDGPIDARQAGKPNLAKEAKQRSEAEVLEAFGVTFGDIIDGNDEPVNLGLYEQQIARYEAELDNAMKLAGVATDVADSVAGVLGAEQDDGTYRGELEFNSDGTPNPNWSKE